MDVASDWSLVELDEEPEKPAETPHKDVPAAHADHVPRQLIAAIVAIVAVAVGLAIWATMPSGGVQVDSQGGAFNPLVAGGAKSSFVAASFASGSFSALRSAAPSTGGRVVVDVEGAVTDPGVHELAEGARVGDAIGAAGGYSSAVNIVAASAGLNLAAKLTDGQQIHVPALGEQVGAAVATEGVGTGGATGTDPGGATSGTPIDINHASSEELDTLPGIGPVTAAKIIDARTQAPFATVDELQSRGVVGPSTFEKLRDLITVTP